MSRRVFTIGFEVPGGVGEVLPFDSDHALLDADIIIFQPMLGYVRSHESFQGKTSLTEDSSFQVREHLSHWRTELKAAVEAGKLVVIYLATPEEVYAKTGKKDIVGTGKSPRVTNYVDLVTSYSALPLNITVHPRRGTQIVPVKDLSYLAPYWLEFGSMSPYEVTIEGKFSEILLRTRSGDHTVGATIKSGLGCMLLLPPISYDVKKLTKYDPKKKKSFWTEDATAFGNKLITSLVGISDIIKKAGSLTPPPDWSLDTQYRMEDEGELETAIQKASQEIEQLQAERSRLKEQLRAAGQLRNLLYERGKPLENAIIESLRLMGFKAENFKEGESEFDAVFSSPEGRFLGEAEGKDNKAINIDKLSQLERNIQEDFNREAVKDYAKGVLFGNAFRLTPPESRSHAFTDKCISGAKRSRVALVKTLDLFRPAKYLKENKDEDYGMKCRMAIMHTEGELVVFPEPPFKE